MPKHTRLKHADGTVGTSHKKKTLKYLRTCSKQIPWSGVITKTSKEGHNQNEHFRNNILFTSVAEIQTDDYTIEELDEVLKNAKN